MKLNNSYLIKNVALYIYVKKDDDLTPGFFFFLRPCSNFASAVCV